MDAAGLPVSVTVPASDPVEGAGHVRVRQTRARAGTAGSGASVLGGESGDVPVVELLPVPSGPQLQDRSSPIAALHRWAADSVEADRADVRDDPGCEGTSPVRAPEDQRSVPTCQHGVVRATASERVRGLPRR